MAGDAGLNVAASGPRRLPRVLIVNCFSDNHRHARGSGLFVPQSIAAITLAGQLNKARIEVRVHCEFARGPLQGMRRLGWPDLLVLTGLNPAFDRMRHLTAYARTLNPRVVVAVGGPLARVLPKLCAQYFDRVCHGDVEELGELVDELFGPGHRCDDPFPRFDLQPWNPLVGFAESSRNCNFRCGFCAMTAEDRPHSVYGLETLQRQIEAQAHRPCVMLLDQNFYGGSRTQFRTRLDLLRASHEAGILRGWAALVTADFFHAPENLAAARAAGCIGLFSGVESFSPAQIAAYRKKQNLILPQESLIRGCLEAGLTFHYGMMFDPTEQKIEVLEEELELLLDNHHLTLPSFLSFAIPLLGTPFFQQRLREGSLLPDLKLRDMDGRSVICHSLDPLDRVIAFARRIDRAPFPRARLLTRAGRFYAHYRSHLRGWSMASALSTHWAMAYPRIGNNGREGWSGGRRSLLASTEKAGSLYTPAMRLAARYQDHFQPLYITDALGELNQRLVDDLGTGTMQVPHPVTGLFD